MAILPHLTTRCSVKTCYLPARLLLCLLMCSCGDDERASVSEPSELLPASSFFDGAAESDPDAPCPLPMAGALLPSGEESQVLWAQLFWHPEPESCSLGHEAERKGERGLLQFSLVDGKYGALAVAPWALELPEGVESSSGLTDEGIFDFVVRDGEQEVSVQFRFHEQRALVGRIRQH